MNFDDIKWAVRELAAAFTHRPGCDCSTHNRLGYAPRKAPPSDEPDDNSPGRTAADSTHP